MKKNLTKNKLKQQKYFQNLHSLTAYLYFNTKNVNDFTFVIHDILLFHSMNYMLLEKWTPNRCFF